MLPSGAHGTIVQGLLTIRTSTGARCVLQTRRHWITERDTAVQSARTWRLERSTRGTLSNSASAKTAQVCESIAVYVRFMFAHAGRAERIAHATNVKLSSKNWEDPKSETKRDGTLALLLPKSVLVWVYAWYKRWEGRTVLSCLRMWGRLPCVGNQVSLAAGCGKNGIVYCVVEEVIVARKAREVVNGTNWKQFVPWVKTLTAARRVYDDMDVGSGMVFMRLGSMHKTDNIGFKSK